MQSLLHFQQKFQNKFIGRKLFCMIFLVVLGFSIYGNTLNNELFWDDDQFILENQYIRDWESFPKFFSENVIAGAGRSSDYWRPALLTVFSIEWHMWGDSPFGFHLTNTLFHIAGAVFLFLTIDRIFKRRFLSLFVSAIFLVHPLQTEAVSYANSLGDSLSVFFIFGSVLLFTIYRQREGFAKRSYIYFLSIASFALALMSKETAIVTPFLITLVDIFLEAPKSGIKLKIKNIVLRNLPFYLLGIGYVALRSTALNFVNTFNLYDEANVFTRSIWVRLFTFMRILTVYLSLIFWPFNLHMERSVSVATSILEPDILLGGLMSILLIVIGFKSYKKYPALSFGIFWFFIALSPTSNILVPINGMLYEHWLYVPLVGIALAVASVGGSSILLFPKIKKLAPALAIIIVFLLCVRTIVRNRDWDNSITFYNQVLSYSPESYRVTNNLGMELAERGRHNEALPVYYRAIVLDDKNPVAYHNLGNSYKEMGKFDLAALKYNKALELDSNFYYSYGALANLYLEQKNYIEAEKVLKNYLARDPNNANVREVLLGIQKLKK